MVNIVKIRGSVFAPYASAEPIKDPATGRVFEYAEMHVSLHHKL